MDLPHASPVRKFGIVASFVAAFGLLAGGSAADDKKPAYPAAPDARNVPVMPEAWKTTPDHKLTAKELDELLDKHLKDDALNPAPLTTDEQFIRRAYLDLTGKPPTAAQVEKFVADTEADKRAKLIDELLDSDDFNRHWAVYWRNVMASHATDPFGRRLSRNFDTWMTDQLKAKKSWSEITREIITADGEIRFDGTGEPNGAIYFTLLHQGSEADNERAAETSRVFMGIQISCAQCHDHPTDIWKRDQFHEFAAFYARIRERFIFEEQRIVGIRTTSLPRGEHRMPGKDDPRRGAVTKHPKFLTGESVRQNLSDADRRKALADLVTSKDNFWFSAAYANRMWAVLMGQGFYMPVDNLGPLQEAVYPDVLMAVAVSFRSTDYDMRELFRLIMNTRAYQRQSKIGKTTTEHLLFSSTYPTRMSADALYRALTNALGPMDRGPGGGGGRPMGPGRGFGGGLQSAIRDAFDFDPSIKPDEVEGSVPQKLLLMNNPLINSKIKATGDTPLARILKGSASDEEAVKSVYLHTLSRKPSAKELETCLDYIKTVRNRGEAFEDILWSLINSTEFQTRR